MAEFSPIYKIIEDAITLDVANPNLAISTKEQALKDAAIRLGTLDYYRSFPMRINMETQYNSGYGNASTFNWSGLSNPVIENGQMIIPFDSIFTQGSPKVPPEQIQNAYFLGVMRVERPAWSNWSNPANWDAQLLGLRQQSVNQYDITKTLLSNTLDELSTGQPRYTINRMQNRIEVLQSWGFGLYAWDFAIGFTSPEYVEASKWDWLCKFISLRFIESIITARSSVAFDADFKISTDALQERLKTLKEEVESIRNHSVLHINQWT